jgi:phosphoserine phosphatase
MHLVAFDFDGTLSDSEMTVLLGENRSVAGEMADITEQAMNDEIDYATSLRERAALLDGLAETDAQQAFDQVRLRDGAADLISMLREEGIHVSILTGGFEQGVQTALDNADITVDSIVANRLPVDAGSLTGTVEGPLIEGTKDEALRDLTRELDVDLDNVVAVGDGANDLPMLELAGYAVGYDPKPAVEPACDVTVSAMADLRELLTERGLLNV